MKKKLVIALSSTLAVATAVPALALTNEVAGFYRVRGMMADLSTRKDQKPDKLVDQRFRAKWTLGVNEYVKVVYFGEVDFQFGDSAYNKNFGGGIMTRNEGGGMGGDTTNVETKNLYMELKIPNTAYTATVGLQGYGDNIDNVLLASDIAGIKVAGKAGPVDFNAAWFKLAEGDVNANDVRANDLPNGSVAGGAGSEKEDDVTLYAVQASMKPSDALKVGADLYYFDNQGTPNNFTGTKFRTGKGNKEELWYLSLNGAFKLPMVNLSGWLLYNTGTEKKAVGGKDQSVNGMALSAKAEATVSGANVGARLIYWGADKTLNTNKSRTAIVQPFAGTAPECLPFAKEGLQLMLANADQISYPAVTRNAAGYAMGDAAYAGYGLFGGVVNASFTPPTMKKLYVKGALGYFQSLEKTVNNNATKRKGTALGTEISAKVGYLLVDNVDLSVAGAYAMLGSFYDKSDAGKDPSDPFILALQANVNF